MRDSYRGAHPNWVAKEWCLESVKPGLPGSLRSALESTGYVLNSAEAFEVVMSPPLRVGMASHQPIHLAARGGREHSFD